MDEDTTRHIPSEKEISDVIDSIQSLPEKKEKLSEKEYMESLEKCLIDLLSVTGFIAEEYGKSVKLTDDYSNLTQEWMRMFETEHSISDYLTGELAKHRKGKQVSQENKELYALILRIDKERVELGEDSDFKQSTKRAVFQKYRSKIGWEKYYRNFIEFKNKPFKRKESPK